ncbi:ribonuclease R [Cupriavidus respiraculi]|uniref:ribonuclease R n=1 Tax=Cupriavidus respiraculi TaxID=195930 RepID=UPI001EECDCC4|nr:ribonuclease R [Cupriavidus respiraculi]
MNQNSYPIPSREEILGVLRTSGSPLSAGDIAKALAVTRKEHDGFQKRLAAMERDGQIELNRKGRYELAHQPNFVVGRVQGHRDGFGFLIRDDAEDDIFLPERELQKAMHNDRAQVRVVGYDRRGRPEGQIVEIVERANRYVIGRLLNEGGVLVVAPEDKRISQDILIPPKAQGKAKVGQVVSVEIVEYPDRYVQPVGRVIEVLGDIDDPGMEIEIAVRKYGVPHAFSPDCLSEAAALPDSVQQADLDHRIDLRDVPLVTIDGEDARDFDDAVYCEPVKIGRTKAWRLVVAIADVSHYVRPGTALDADAIDRATSVYFPRRVIPMLPEKISNGLCSLNPQVDRLCMVCDTVITSKGEIKAYQFYPAVMHSAARLTYNEVWAVLSNTKGPEAHKRADLVPHLQNLYELFQTLLKARRQRGAIDFDTTETYIVCNAQGKIEQILPRTRNDAHRLIEECMLTANVCAADFLERFKHPALYRVHAGPNEEKLKNLREFLRTAGLSLGGGDKPHASDYAEVMDKIKARPDAPMLQTMLLRSMQQAVYSPDNIGHFGLAYEAYAHFTSPIRRYPDLLVHRAIKAVLAHTKYKPVFGHGIQFNTAVSPKARRLQAKDAAAKAELAAGRAQRNEGVWDELGLHCSANERRADEASRDVEAWLKCYFMRDKLGSEYAGTVSSVTSFGIFVQLDELYVEGLVHVTELGSDYFQYDEARNELRGERTGIRYRLTDRVRVQVSRVDLDARKIDFRLVQEPSVKAPRARPTVADVAPHVPAAHAVPARKKGRQLAALLGGTSKPEESFDETLDRVIEEQPVFEAVITPIDAPPGTGGKPSRRTAKPKPQHAGSARKSGARSGAKAGAKAGKAGAKSASKTSRAARKR